MINERLQRWYDWPVSSDWMWVFLNEDLGQIRIVSKKKWYHCSSTGDMPKFSETKKVTEYVETIPYFVIKFWGKKLTNISLFWRHFLKLKIWENKISQWFLEPGNWQKPYNYSSIVVIIHLKKIQFWGWFFNQGKLQKKQKLGIFFDATNEIEN